jgi:aryl-alcohol dehydrogenase-like predicted oxidoreductase/predicted kinase
MWLDAELRIALGCMRIDASRAEEIFAAAVDAGITVFDTARAYGESEALVGRMLRGRRAFIVTKGGMRRPDGAWEPDGRARSLREDCEASLRALDRPIDLYLVHAPDPRVPWATTVRALARLLDEKLVARIGVSNVNRKQLDEAIDLAPISAVQVVFGPALRGGVVSRCRELGIEVLAHSPLGGPARAPRWTIAHENATPQETVLAALRKAGALPIAGATRAQTVRSIARSARVVVSDDVLVALDLAPRTTTRAESSAEIVLVMGLQGSGKSTFAMRHPSFERLNRDLEGGSMKMLHCKMAARLADGARAMVLDNTYATRASRHEAIATAHAHGARVRGIFIDVTMADAQINVVDRMLRAHGRLLEPEEMERPANQTSIGPGVLFRTARVLERPSSDEGFAELEIVSFEREPSGSKPATFISIDAKDPPTEGLRFFFGWKPGERSSDPNVGICPHGGGPPVCWCRPPLPGLLLAWARANDVDVARSAVVGTSTAHRTMAKAIGASYVDAR